jgi:uncharacterized RDD family membrane protein YckC
MSAATDRPIARSADDPLITGEAVALDVRPASAIIRAGGTAIDVAVSLALLVGVAFALLGVQADEAATRAILITSLVTVLVVLPTAVETASRGRSLGKLALGLRVVRDDGGAIGFRHAFVRALTGVLEIYLTFGGLAVLVGFLNPSSKRLGDVLAGTHAQSERAPRVPTQTFGVPPELTTWAATADVGRIPDVLERRIAGFFANAGHLVPASRARVAASLADEVAPYVEPRPDAPADRFLAAVVAVRRERDLTALRLEQQRLDALAPVLDVTPQGFPSRS